MQNFNPKDLKVDALIAYIATKHGREYWHSAKFKGFISSDLSRVLVEFADGRKRIIDLAQIRSIKQGAFWDEDTYSHFLESKVIADARSNKE